MLWTFTDKKATKQVTSLPQKRRSKSRAGTGSASLLPCQCEQRLLQRHRYSVTEADKILKLTLGRVRLEKGTGGWEGEKRRRKSLCPPDDIELVGTKHMEL